MKTYRCLDQAADAASTLPSIPCLDDFIHVEEVTDLPVAVAELFQRQFRLGVPNFPHHFVAMVKQDDAAAVPGCYTHASDCGDIALGGGACTDSRVLRRLDRDQRQRLREAGGIYRYTLVHMLMQLRTHFPVLFACCGDGLSERVMLATNFGATGQAQLFAHWMHAVAEPRRSQMIAKAKAFMPF